jgi:hypothetical protein
MKTLRKWLANSGPTLQNMLKILGKEGNFLKKII